jgi:hypothetical protein
MRRAQMDLDIEPEKYKHYYLNELPERYNASLDVRVLARRTDRLSSLHRRNRCTHPSLAA